MAIRDLIPWSRRREVTVRPREEFNPFLTLHWEMNRLFVEVFRGFDLAPFGGNRLFDRAMGWPNIEVSETNKEVRIMAELPGLHENDVEVELVNGVLAIKGEKKTETEDKDRLFSERYYGRFERRIPRTWTRTGCPAAFKNVPVLALLGTTGKEAAPNPNPFLPIAGGSHANPRCISSGLE
jgi:HSP20 family protein